MKKTLVRTKSRTEMKPKEYQGGFSNEVFEALKEYASSGLVFGYLGHEGRTIELDKVIEEELKNMGLTPHLMYCWISSTDGRHTMDYIEDKPLWAQIEYIRLNKNSIYNLCIIYNDPEQDGTLDSTIKVREKLKYQGILKPDPIAKHRK